MRVLEAELLDVLPATDQRAQHSRRDLRKLNAIMGHHRLMTRMMRHSHFQTLIDLGSGDGSFAVSVARKIGRPFKLVLVDRQRVVDAPPEMVVADVMEFMRGLNRCPGTAIMANLFLHHFTDAALRDLFAEVARAADWFFACEPRRSQLSLAAARFLPLIGCNAVTQHDALASIRAGFLERELSALWPSTNGSADSLPANGWELTEREGRFASHCFMASRIQR